MSWLSEAHNDWHTINGRNVTCPLDCGAGEQDEYWLEWVESQKKFSTVKLDRQTKQWVPAQAPEPPF